LVRSPLNREHDRALRRSGTRSEGFTLIEVVVALTLFALLLVFLFGGLRFGNRAVSVGTDMIERAVALTTAETFLRNQLAAAEPLPITSDNQRREVTFDGRRDAVDFVALPPAYLVGGGFHWLRVGLEKTSGGNALVVRWQPLRRDESGETLNGMDVLLQGVNDVAFSYFGSPDGVEPRSWHDEWHNAAFLPALVRVRIAVADGRPVPDLLVAPHITTTVSERR
jgi:general secretion pathway protein J